MTTAYCTANDLLVGKVPLPSYLDPDKFVQDAADEIDSKIACLYMTPVNTSAGGVSRVVELTLKRINSHLASGRLLLSVAAPEEQARTHAYGLFLVKEAEAAIDAIASGEFKLEGALPADGVEPDQVSMPLISNLDDESSVEAFYDRISNPCFVFPERYPRYRYTGRS